MDIFGASGHGKVILDIALLNELDITGIWDDNLSSDFAGYRITGNLSQLQSSRVEEVIIAIGNNKIRKNIASLIQAKFSTLIHPTAVIARSTRIGVGTALMANVVVNADTRVGNHVILNTNCTVDHDCTIGDYVHISPKAGLAGNVEVQEGAHIGIGAVIIQGVRIGKWATIGAGAVIIRDVPDYAVVVGNPGQIIKYNNL